MEESSCRSINRGFPWAHWITAFVDCGKMTHLPVVRFLLVQIPLWNDEELVAAYVGGADIFGEIQILCNVWLPFASVVA